MIMTKIQKGESDNMIDFQAINFYEFGYLSSQLYINISKTCQFIKKMSEEVQAHILKRYNLIKKVGSGAYGIVWKVTDKKGGETLALKKIFDAFQHSTDAQRTFRQITLLHEIEHPNMVRLSQVMRAQNDKDLYLVFEYMEADLHNAINQKILKDAHTRFILYQLCKGIKFLHSAQIIHRDLKPSNLLLNSDCTMKICDFGLARSLIADKFNQDVILTEEVATRWYRAPEVLLGSHSYGKSADIWSIGCILAQILVGKPIFPGSSTLNQIEKILTFTGKPTKAQIESLSAENAETMIQQVANGKPKHLNEWFKAGTPAQAIDLVVKMLQFNPKKRPTAAQLLKSNYLSGFSNPKDQVDSKRMIKPPISDNTKLNLKDYRSLIYDHIRRVYREKEISSSLHTSQSAKRKERPNTAEKCERVDCNSQFYQRSSSNNAKNEKLKTSEIKPASYILTAGKANVVNSFHEQQQKIKKKSSIKQLLKNKKSLVSYKTTNDGKISIPKKPAKEYEYCSTASTKENKSIYSKFC